jgi:hypothetical protein
VANVEELAKEELVYVEELAKEELVLISTEAFMDYCTEGWPVGSENVLFHGLEPPGHSAGETHGRYEPRQKDGHGTYQNNS